MVAQYFSPSAAAAYGSRLRRTAATLNRQSVRQAYVAQTAHYDLLRRYYAAEVYERHDANAAAIKAWEGLPRHIRPIALVPRRAVEWWPGHVFPGAWTSDGLPASNGRPNRIAYDTDVSEEVRIAAQQAFTWANGPRFLLPFVRGGAMLGNAFAEVVADPARRKVYPKLIEPDYVVELERNATGDVTAYRLAIPMVTETGQPYLWGKRVDRETVTTYYDDEPRGYDDQPATIENPYGFVPAVWVSHVETGGTHGASCIDGTLPLLDELNGLLSAVDDYIMRFVHQHVIVESPNPADLKRKLDAAAGATPAATDDYTSRQSRGRQEIGVLPAPTGTAVHHLLANLGLADADPHITRIEAQIEKAFPEIVLSDKLLEMTQVTRPGALPLVQDVQHKYDESAGNYYDAVAQLAEMCCTIGGYHANAGDWGLRSHLTDQQQKFLPFGFDSWAAGDVSVSITPGELIPRSMTELAQEALAMESVKTATGLRHVGLSDDDIYGEGVTSPPRRGILEEKAGGAASFAETLGRAFDTGRVS